MSRALIALAYIGAAGLVLAVQIAVHEITPPLPDCPTEDGTNCIWDATEQGNGIGRSFVDIDGATYYLEVAE